MEALAAFLRENAVGHVLTQADLASVQAIKTFDPPLSALAGLEVTGASRHGKFLDLDVSGLHLVVHLARAGWLHWRDALPPAPPKPGKGPLALRVSASRSTRSRSCASRRTRRSTSPIWTPSCRCSASRGTRSSTPYRDTAMTWSSSGRHRGQEPCP